MRIVFNIASQQLTNNWHSVNYFEKGWRSLKMTASLHLSLIVRVTVASLAAMITPAYGYHGYPEYRNDSQRNC